MDKIVITKVGGTQKTFPRGILKVRDPAKPPPKRKTARHTIQLITDRGTKHYKKTLKRRISKLSDVKLRALVEKHGLVKNKNTPPALMRDMIEGGVMSGFISLEK